MDLGSGFGSSTAKAGKAIISKNKKASQNSHELARTVRMNIL
jgi:hypothetical protein